MSSSQSHHRTQSKSVADLSDLSTKVAKQKPQIQNNNNNMDFISPKEDADPERETVVSLVLSEFLQSKPPPPSSTIKILVQLIRNASTNGEKYQTISLSNEVIKTKVVAIPGAQNVLSVAGFQPRGGNESQTWVFKPTAATMTDAILSQLTDALPCSHHHVVRTSNSTQNADNQFLSDAERRERSAQMLEAKRRKRQERLDERRKWQEEQDLRKDRKQQLGVSEEVVIPGVRVRKLGDADPSSQTSSLQLLRELAREKRMQPMVPNHDGMEVEKMNDEIESVPAAQPQPTSSIETSALETRLFQSTLNEPDEDSKPSAVHSLKSTHKSEGPDLATALETYSQIPRCESATGIRDSSHFVNHPDNSKQLAPSCLKQIFQELNNLKTSLPDTLLSSIWLRFDEDSPQYMRALIAAPLETPYAGGLFAFDIRIPNCYPEHPPAVHLLTTGGATPFGPNLYTSGKVCLSLLGTWPGPKWQPRQSSLHQVLVSIQGLILGVTHPYFLEPGHGGWEGRIKEGEFTSTGHTLRGDEVKAEIFLPPEAAVYEDKIRFATLRHAILQMMNVPSNLKMFEHAIRSHFFCNQDKILHEVSSWIDEPLALSATSVSNISPMKKLADAFRLMLLALEMPTPGMIASADQQALSRSNEDVAMMSIELDGEKVPASVAKVPEKPKSSAVRVEALRLKMHDAASQGDFIKAGKLQELIGRLDSLVTKMNDAATGGDFIRAGRIQEQMEALLPTPEQSVTQPTDPPQAGQSDHENAEYFEDVDSAESQDDEEDEEEFEQSNNAASAPIHISGFKLGKNVFVPPARMNRSQVNPRHAWGCGTSLTAASSTPKASPVESPMPAMFSAKAPPVGSACKLRFRLPDGSTQTHVFNRAEQLSAVYEIVKLYLGDVASSKSHVPPLVTGGAFAQPLSANGFTLLLSHPKKEFNLEMHGTKSLESLGLSPSATLTIMHCEHRGVVHRGELAERLNEAQGNAMDVDGLTYEGLLELTERVGPAEPVDGASFLTMTEEALEANSSLISPSCYIASCEEADDAPRCPVCLGDFDRTDPSPCLRRLHACSHAFHATCLETWLRTKSACPICKTPVA